MKDKIFELYDKCPKCGKCKGLYYSMQFPLEVNKTLNGKTFIRRYDKRVTRLSNRQKAFLYDIAQCNAEIAVCVCEFCGWKSEPIVQ